MRLALASYASSRVVPLGMLYLASALRRAGHEVQWHEASSASELIRGLRERRAQVVGFGASTGMHTLYLDWAGRIRDELGIPILFGGPHPTFVPDMVHHAAVDAIFIGESEKSIVEYLDMASEGRWGTPVSGVWYKQPGDQKNRELIKGPVRAPPLELDTLPWPALDLVYDRYPARGRYGVKPFMASRGCAYRCTYCANAAYLSLYGREVPALRLRSPARVIDEIRWVKRTWGLRLAWLADASLLTEPQWAAELVSRIRAEVRVPFFCKVRPDHIDRAAAKMLGQAGCFAVGLGVESGDPAIRRRVLGRPIADETIERACHLLHEAGVRVLTFNMLGIPTESWESALATLDLNIRCRADYAEAMLLQPYPGTPIATWAKRKGHYDGNHDHIDYSYLSVSPFHYQDESLRDRLERLQQLFALAVEFPEVRRVLPRLVERRSKRLYDALFRVWYHVGFGTRVHALGRWR